MQQQQPPQQHYAMRSDDPVGVQYEQQVAFGSAPPTPQQQLQFAPQFQQQQQQYMQQPQFSPQMQQMQLQPPSYGGGGVPPSPSQPPTLPQQSQRMLKLQALQGQHEIRPDWIPRLRQLEGFSIVFIADDSGSMNTDVTVPGRVVNPYGPRCTRWTELCQTVSTVVELATALNDAGVDIVYLNRPPMRGVTSAAQVQAAFAHAPPSGYTPLARVVREVIALKTAEHSSERKLLIMIATDGEPTTDGGVPDVPGFLRLLKTKPANVHVQIMACTDDDSVVGYLNDLDDTTANLDVCDDYASEKAEILAAQGRGFDFSTGDYIVKALLGPVDREFDTLDQKKGGGGHGGGGGAGVQGDECCVVA